MTEIEKLIDRLNNEFLSHEINHDDKGSPIRLIDIAMTETVKSILAMLTESLPAERQAIEEAYKDGRKDGMDLGLGEEPQYLSSSDYFNKTYNK